VQLADEVGLTEQEIREFDRVVTIACGTSAYAGRVGKYLIEHLARLPVEVDYGSEFRYRDPILNEQTLVLAISQSGETVDTLAAMETARSRGGKLVSIVNVIGSQAALVSDGVIHMHAGPEIGVASTKAFTASLVDQYLLALYLGQVRGTLDPARAKELVGDLARLPGLASEVLGRGAEYDALAVQFSDRTDFLYLGRGINYPIALEGALKLKEITYIHAEGYPAGEMKHGPIALIDERMPVVAIAVRDNVFDKMICQIEQVKARGGTVIAVAFEQDDFVRSRADHVIPVPAASPLLTPVLTVLPLQLFAYYMAVQLGTDVDQPRNLAKSVTVE
jgi:glucosamine--fructose-6-phosphate aminotransferase (isomerizing)